MIPNLVYAHSRPGATEDTWEPLRDHLEGVAEMAESFAEAFGSAQWGRLAGLWHDLGKYRPEFQRLLRGSREQIEHAGIGAALAAGKATAGLPLAFVIAGHHAGLANRVAQADTTLSSLVERLEKNRPVLERLQGVLPTELMALSLPPLPPLLLPTDASRSAREVAARRVELWTRFLFSALVDADRLATEAFYEPGKREGARTFDSMSRLRERLDQQLSQFRPDTPVNRLRARVLDACRAAGEHEPGIFSLTVPTGGGKTLSSMAFALAHGERYGMRRVIVVIPYTSIIEQNAKVYRAALGPGNVIEHQSNFDETKALETDSEMEVRRRLAAENWDAPVIVTTNVQFFESLFANHPSRCRKLHNVARSVIVLDEAQNLPADYLSCVLEAMRELTNAYGCTLVLMTATQPALGRRDTLPGGLEDVREIVPGPGSLARALERVTVSWPASRAAPTPYAALAEEVKQHARVLVIVHLRRDARTLTQHLPADHRYHLSALMCPAHRSDVLATVKERLEAGLPCRVVATQLIEAGVDISFPMVYRALAGLDSVAQAAGRCNRDGELRDASGNSIQGQVCVFRAETRPPPGILRLGLESSEALLTRHGDHLNFSSTDYMDEYFRILYGKCETDKKGVQAERSQFNFATVAQKVQLIEDEYTRPVVVPWGTSATRVAAFRAVPKRETQRALQPYLVQIPERNLERLRGLGAVERVHDQVDVLLPYFGDLYDPTFGLVIEENARADPRALVI